MTHKTKIEWMHVPGYVGATWKPLAGCNDHSSGCINCYARGIAGTRLKDHPFYQGLTRPGPEGKGPLWTGKISRDYGDRLTLPLDTRKPHAFFLTSMGDVFHEGVPQAYIDLLFGVMALCPQYLFIVLTHRADRMRAYFEDLAKEDKVLDGLGRIHAVAGPQLGDKICDGEWEYMLSLDWPLPNVWLVASASTQDDINRAVPDLLNTPAAIRGLSLEPLVNYVTLNTVRLPPIDLEEAPNRAHWGCALTGEHGAFIGLSKCVFQDRLPTTLDWVICGGESGRGKGIRPMHPAWARAIRDECAAANVPFFFKQWGEWAPSDQGALIGTDPDIAEHDCAFDMSRAETMARIGKGKAGHLLDGEPHHAWPEIRV